MKSSVLALILIGFVGCAKEPKATAETPKTDPTPKAKEAAIGKAISSSKTVSLSELVRNPSSYENQTLVTEGTVKRVCQSMGCWMEIVDDKSQAHVKFAAHSFFVPKDSHGKKARIEGRVLAPEGSNDACKADGCRKGNPLDEGLAQVDFEATGVELR